MYQLALFAITISVEVWPEGEVLVERSTWWNGWTQVLSYQYI
jgi:hypothetical protein